MTTAISIRIRTVVRFLPVYACPVSWRHRSTYEVGRVSAVRFPNVISPWQLAAFMNGMFAVWICLGFAVRVQP